MGNLPLGQHVLGFLQLIRHENALDMYIYIYIMIKAHSDSDSSLISLLAVLRLKSIQRSAHPEGSVCSLAIASWVQKLQRSSLDVFAQKVPG